MAESAIGRGWRVKGLTLSEEQRRHAVQRLQRLGARDVEFALQDYRDERGVYDGIASVEMFEAQRSVIRQLLIGSPRTGALAAELGGAFVRCDVTQEADAQAVAGLLAHWQQSLVDIGFLDPQAPKKLMPRLQQLFNRAQLSEEEVHILRGIARHMSDASRRNKLD